MEHHIRSIPHAFRAHGARRRPKQREQFGRAAADILVRVPLGLPDRLPTRARLRDGLVGARLVLAPDLHAGRFRPVIRQLDQPLFSSVWGSLTRTIPLLRLRSAVPVGHQVRVFWYELPAAASTRRMVVAPSRGNLSRRSVRSSVLSDHVAVPSVFRSGERWAVATMRARAAGS